MKILFLFFAIISTIKASNIINQTIYDTDSRVDIMLSFDTAYSGKIEQRKDKDGVILLLKNAFIQKSLDKKINSSIVQKMQIVPFADGAILKLHSDKEIALKASKTNDNLGLRLRITPKIKELDESLVIQNQEDRVIQTKEESDIAGSYLKVLFVLFLLAFLLYLLKRFLIDKEYHSNSSWLFDKRDPKESASIKVLQQKGLDHKNRVALISYNEKKYLLLLGESNILLDRFDANSDIQLPKFEQELKENQDALKEFIEDENHKLRSYKEKASYSKI